MYAYKEEKKGKRRRENRNKENMKGNGATINGKALLLACLL
jgi:hypothetical protein